MRGLTVPRSRRRRPGAAAAAYSIALNVLRDPSRAERVAIAALRSGARSRIGVLSHARHIALGEADGAPATGNDELASSDVRQLALQLAGTRQAIERVIVDLEGRYGLDTSSFARTLGLSSERAQERARSVATTWAEQLDPAMMAWLGPGSCSELETILCGRRLWPRSTSSPVHTGEAPVVRLLPTGTDDVAVTDPAMIADPNLEAIDIGMLLESAPAVSEHASHCSTCNERLRLIRPVRTLVGQLPLEAVPPAVAAAAHASRRRLPGGLAPSIEARRIDIHRLRWIIVALTGVVIVAAAAVGITRAADNSGETQADRVERLLQSASASRLLATPTVMTPATTTAALANNGNEPILWHATTSAAWLSVSPTDGRLGASQSTSIAVTAAPPAFSSGVNNALITFTGSDGSTQTIRYQLQD